MKGGRVTVAMHTGAILKPKVIATIIAQAGLIVDQIRAPL
jgi:predicted RNA binding protein YcfA (HicA-like mRNA interferase family)